MDFEYISKSVWMINSSTGDLNSILKSGKPKVDWKSVGFNHDKGNVVVVQTIFVLAQDRTMLDVMLKAQGTSRTVTLLATNKLRKRWICHYCGKIWAHSSFLLSSLW